MIAGYFYAVLLGVTCAIWGPWERGELTNRPGCPLRYLRFSIDRHDIESKPWTM